MVISPHRRTLPLALATSLATLVAPAATAQLNGVPIWTPRVPDPLRDHAIFFSGHATTGQDFVGSTASEWGATLAARSWVFERIVLTGAFGITKRNAPPNDRHVLPQYGLSAGVKLWHHVDPVDFWEVIWSAFGGYGYSSLPGPADEQNIPAGSEIGLRLPGGGFFLEPSLAVRWHWRRTELVTGHAWQNGPGVTGTFAFKWTQWTAIFAADVVDLDAVVAGAAALPNTMPWAFSVGVQLGF